MKEYDFKNTVLVIATHGERFIGTIKGTISPREQIKQYHEEGKAIEMENVYVLAMAQQGGPGGKVLQTVFLVPPDNLMMGAGPSIMVTPSAWHFPSDLPVKDAEAYKKKLDALYSNAEKGEAQAKAAEAGIHIPGAPGAH